MASLAKAILTVLAVLVGLFGLVGMWTVSVAGGAVYLCAAILLWPTVGARVKQVTGKAWVAPVFGGLLALIVGPVATALTAPTAQEMAVAEAQRQQRKAESIAAAEAERAAKEARQREAEAKEAAKKRKRDDEVTEIKMQRLAREFVKANLRDPESAQFRNQRGGCGEVNAKNSFGGYPGYRRFIAASKELVFIEGENGLSGAEFQTVWDRVCK